MERKCKKCVSAFTVEADEEAFLGKIGFKFGTTEFHPPLPIHCPDCRCQIRVAHRNENNFYKVRSAFSGKDIISVLHADSPRGEPYKIYSQEEWKSDAWDPMEYGRDFDFSRPFFDQFHELQKAVPRMALTSLANENSGFSTGTAYCKNCYLINSSENCEDCYYGKLFQDCKSCVDCSYAYNCELCYECFSVHKCYACQWVSFSVNSNDCYFSSGLTGCKNCFLCTNLVNKEYHFMNKPLERAEYEKRVAEFRGSYRLTEQVKEMYKQQMSAMSRKYANIVNCMSCSGDYIDGSRNCRDSYDMNDSEDCRYVQVGVNVKDIYDCSNMYLKPELCYEILGTIETYGSAYCIYIFHSKNVLYSEYLFSCHDCFGCSGLTRKEYCIFNKQYTKEEYEALVPKIIEHMKQTDEWGMFFPASLSPFTYNESVALEYFPLTKEEALKQGFTWRESDVRDFKPATLSAIPDKIGDVTDGITQEILACAETGKNYRIIPQELKFYREQKLPLPKLCPEVRYKKRLELRNPRKLYDRKCGECDMAVETTYDPERPERILCEECFRNEVF